MHLTPDILAGAYAYLRETPPFRQWQLPPPEELEFHVWTSRNYYGGHERLRRSKVHRISVSCGLASHSMTVLRVTAHEMIHLHQKRRGTETPNAEHNAEFHRFAARVCREHGFDPKEF